MIFCCVEMSSALQHVLASLTSEVLTARSTTHPCIGVPKIPKCSLEGWHCPTLELLNVKTEDATMLSISFPIPEDSKLCLVWWISHSNSVSSILTERPPPHASWVTLNKVAKLGEHQFHLWNGWSLLNSEAVVPSTEASVLPWASPAPLSVPCGSENMVRSLPNLPSTRVKEQGCVKKWSQWGDVKSQL